MSDKEIMKTTDEVRKIIEKYGWTYDALNYAEAKWLDNDYDQEWALVRRRLIFMLVGEHKSPEEACKYLIRRFGRMTTGEIAKATIRYCILYSPEKEAYWVEVLNCKRDLTNQ